MKRFFYLLLFTLALSVPCHAASPYQIHMMQVSDVTPYEHAYQGFIEGLAGLGMTEGQDFIITRHIIDADVDSNFWEKLMILRKIKKTASEIADAKPDLVVTLGTPTTKYAKSKIIDAGIPLVFSIVYDPTVVGAVSMEKSGPGFTGASIYIDPYNILQIAKQCFPEIEKMGIIHSSDDNSVAFVEETKLKATKLGMTIINEEVNKYDDIAPVAQKMIADGVDAFGVPADTYYVIRDKIAAKTLAKITMEKKIPTIIFHAEAEKGSLIAIGCEFKEIGSLSARHAHKILTENVKPEDLPILYQDKLVIKMDPEALEAYGRTTLPDGVLQLARPL
jgi:putative ABC transport system substrate-binding protein